MATTSEQQLLQQIEQLKKQNGELQSELHQAQQYLSELDHLYRTAPVGLCLMDNDLRFVRINDWLATFNGHPVQDHIGSRLPDMMPEIAATIEPICRRVIENGESELDFEVNSQLSGCRNQHCHLVSFYPVRDDQRNVVGVSTVVQDITERKANEQALQESESRLQTILNHAPEAIVVLDADSEKFVDANHNAEILFGAERNALLQVGPVELSPPTQPNGCPSEESVRVQVEEALQGHAPVFEWVHRNMKGDDIPCEVRLVRLPMSGRNLLRGSVTDITERKLAEKALQSAHDELELRVQRRTAELARSEERFELAVKGTSEGVWDRDLLTDNEWWSDQYYSLLGYQVGEIEPTFDSFRRLLHKDDVAPTLAALQAHLEEHALYDVEYRLRRKSGQYRWFRSRGQALWDETGKAVRIAGSLQDITDRKQAELSLRESELRLKTVISDAPVVITSVNQSGEIDVFDGRALESVGLRPGQFLGRNYFELWQDRSDMTRSMKSCLAGNFPEPTTMDIGNRQLETRYSPMRAASGQVTGAITVCVDVTERVRAEEELRASNNLLTSVLEGTSDAVFVKDEQGRYLMLNSAGARIIGKPVNEIVGQDDTQLFPGDVGRNLRDNDRRVQASGELMSLEEVVVSADHNAPRTYHSTKAPFRDHEGRITGIIGIARDITERKRAEEALRANERLLRRLLDVQETERRMVAHDIHDGFIQYVVGAHFRLESINSNDPEATKAVLDVVASLLKKSIDEGRRLINDLRPMVLDENGIVEAIRHLIADEPASNGLVVAFDHDIQFDRLESKLEGVIFRIIQEALNNVKRHGQTEVAAVQLTQQNDQLTIVVRDQGVGFDPKTVAPASFGLRGIRERARLFGGTARIDSTPGVGTTVFAQLPIGDAASRSETE